MMSITDVLRRVEEASAEAVTFEHLEQIRKSKFNTFITVAEDQSLERARALDSGELKSGGKLAGVPIAIKDNMSTTGIRTTCASHILDGYIPPYDATVVERLYAEGAIVIGKANMDEFAMGTSTESSYYGPTKNPHNPDCVPGGSSGGSAATVAAGEVAISLGSDTGGSVRCPASFCGVVGLKPTYGAVSRYGLVSYANSLEQIGPIASTVADVALLYSIIAGYDPKDSTSVEVDTEISIDCDVEGLTIGIPAQYFGEGIDPAVESAVWDGIHHLESEGATYREVDMPHTDYALAAYYIIAISEASSNLARFDGMRYGLRTEDKDWSTTFSEVRALGFGAEVKRRIILGTFSLSSGYHDKYYLKALQVRTLVKHDFDLAFKDVDVLIAPTMPMPAFRIGELVDPLSQYLADVNTVPINLAGVPSVSVPCGRTQGLPIGMQIIGRYFDEPGILGVAAAVEQGIGHKV
ncbi:MAG TPA: Asp-tRNA(Asn)/Glu-tRNA(Gln) amidotransferase subunit GatA [Methanosarcinales archaeon]|nr:MAG: Asp-tRNA(Asn)/Glu-tRNA(Gln) amidotransferase GatCAB subunit A [Methanosarcinales archaeon]HDN65255.1 Asp-tRNA(Asn)/Glu-tRNA(Gln) amidotransferase subunit GatA [Methanosarcinales archaeon]